MYNLYASQIASLAWSRPGQHEQKTVIAGIALKRLHHGKAGYDEEHELTEEERRTFKEVMEMVRDCLNNI